MKKKQQNKTKEKTNTKQNTLAVNALGTKRKLIKKNQLVILFRNYQCLFCFKSNIIVSKMV
jgi:hypothetical protein